MALRYVFNVFTGTFDLVDSGGGSMPAATNIGQVLHSVDGTTFAPQLPVTDASGWLVDLNGYLVVD